MIHFIIIVGLIFFSIASCTEGDGENQKIKTSDLSSFFKVEPNSNFKRATRILEFDFPKDHADHPDYRTEWWYVTGNLETKNEADKKRRFGFQMTIFRRALASKPPEIRSKWTTNQIYVAHFAVSDIKNNRFYSFERISRDSLSLAGVNKKPFKVWLLDWEIKSDSDEQTGQTFFPLTLVASNKEGNEQIGISLQINPLKPLVLQGEQGLSQKGRDVGNASYYYSFTRLATIGEITINKKIFAVSGLSWFDREWSTSSLDESQQGWDWFSLQLSNNEEIMFYQLRKKDGGIDVTSAGSYIEKSGAVKKLEPQHVVIDILSHWKGPTGVSYPSGWKFDIVHEDIHLTIVPHMNNQEMNFSARYWEGAVKITGSVKGQPVSGHGYVELSGYVP